MIVRREINRKPTRNEIILRVCYPDYEDSILAAYLAESRMLGRHDDYYSPSFRNNTIKLYKWFLIWLQIKNRYD